MGRVRTWSSPPSSARTSSILLDAPFSKNIWANHPTHHTHHTHQPIHPTNLPTHPTNNFNHEGGVPQKSSESKKVSEWSPLHSVPKKMSHIYFGTLCTCLSKKNLNHPLGLTLSTPSLV